MSPLPPLADIRASHAPAVVILGNDALLAARPATPVQLAHACLAAGFHAAVPGSWGDELVADATLTALSTRTQRPVIHCACPHVARRVLAVGSDLAPHLVSLVAPPVAAARYLRRHSSDDLRVTYVGRCPAAADDAIDARLTPEELLAQLVDRGIDLSTQPEVFESVIPPDRRRHLSLPGGVPSPEILWERTRCTVATMKGSEFAAQLADLVLAGTDTLIDPAPMVGCACAGSVRGDATEPRSAVTALEPPRSPRAVVEDGDALYLALELPVAARTATDLVTDSATPVPRDEQRILDGPAEALGDAPPAPPATPNRRPRLTPPGIAAIPAIATAPPGSSLPPRRRSPVGTPRVVPGSVPFGSDSEGRILPRAYVAHRRSPRAGVPAITDSGNDSLTPRAAAPAPTLAVVPMRQPAIAAPPPMHQVEHEPAPTRRDSERPLVRSVEPAASGTAGPSAVREPRPEIIAETAKAWSARLAAAPALLRRNPRVAVTLVVAATGLVLGVAIGYSAARRGSAEPRSAVAPVGQGSDSFDDSTTPRSSGARESVSAGGIAPAQSATRRATTRAPSRPAPAGPVRTGTRTGTRAGPGSNVRRAAADSAVSSPAAPPPLVATVPPAAVPDTAIARARRDSVARVELNSEREAIRREIDARRARVDSIERARLRLDSLRRGEQGGAPPRR